MYEIKDIVNTIIEGDCLEVMKNIPSKSVDLGVTSPPYNLRNSSGSSMKSKAPGGKWNIPALCSGYGQYMDNMPYEEYVEWQRSCLEEMLRLLKPTGAIYYNHKWRVQKGLLQDRQDIVRGFPVRQIIIWQRSGGFNFNPGYYLPTYEVIYLIANKNFKLAPKGNALGDVWSIRQEQNNPHPAPFPVELVDRILGSTIGEVVLDPFMGSGTTALSCKKMVGAILV